MLTRMHELKRVVVIGAGTMGSQIALQTALGGHYEVTLVDTVAGQLEKAGAQNRKLLDRSVEKGRLTRDAADGAFARIGMSADLTTAARDGDLVIEAVIENIDAKRTVFEALGKHAKKDAILASNSSTIAISRLADFTGHPERCCNMHFFHPVTVMQLCEVVRGPKTSMSRCRKASTGRWARSTSSTSAASTFSTARWRTATGSAKGRRRPRCCAGSSSRVVSAGKPERAFSTTPRAAANPPRGGAKLSCPRSPMAEAAGLNPVQREFDPRRGYSHSGAYNLTTMDHRFEEDPDEEPDEPGQPAQPDGARGTAAGLVPTVGLPSREWEYSTKVLTVAQVADGVTVVKVLLEAGAEGWDLASVMDGGDKRVILMRRPKRSARQSRRVGFAPPANN